MSWHGRKAMLPLCPGTMPGNGKGRVPVGSVNATNLKLGIVACGAGPQPRAVALFAGNNAISVDSKMDQGGRNRPSTLEGRWRKTVGTCPLTGHRKHETGSCSRLPSEILDLRTHRTSHGVRQFLFQARYLSQRRRRHVQLRHPRPPVRPVCSALQAETRNLSHQHRRLLRRRSRLRKSASPGGRAGA